MLPERELFARALARYGVDGCHQHAPVDVGLSPCDAPPVELRGGRQWTEANAAGHRQCAPAMLLDLEVGFVGDRIPAPGTKPRHEAVQALGAFPMLLDERKVDSLEEVSRGDLIPEATGTIDIERNDLHLLDRSRAGRPCARPRLLLPEGPRAHLPGPLLGRALS